MCEAGAARAHQKPEAAVHVRHDGEKKERQRTYPTLCPPRPEPCQPTRLRPLHRSPQQTMCSPAVAAAAALAVVAPTVVTAAAALVAPAATAEAAHGQDCHWKAGLLCGRSARPIPRGGSVNDGGCEGASGACAKPYDGGVGVGTAPFH